MKSSPKAEKLRKTLPDEINAHIDHFQKRGRKPMALLRRDGLCHGCYLRNACGISQQFANGENMTFCEHCGRLLIAEPEPEATTSSGEKDPAKSVKPASRRSILKQ